MDEDLRARVSNFLVQRNMSSLRRIGVEAKDGLVTLRGNVRSFYEKQLCLNCAKHVAGVVRLVDNIDVAG
jgi:osmotically-inducible protein OsmY